MTTPAGQATNETPAASRRVVGIILVVLIGLCLLFVAGYVQRLAEKDLLNLWATHVGSASYAVPPGCANGSYIGAGLLEP